MKETKGCFFIETHAVLQGVGLLFYVCWQKFNEHEKAVSGRNGFVQYFN